jgi:hypothetical protein
MAPVRIAEKAIYHIPRMNITANNILSERGIKILKADLAYTGYTASRKDQES